MSKINIFNGKVILPGRIIENGSVLVDNGVIAEVSPKKINAEGCLNIDAQGKYISPGFIDIHTHGGGGSDFMDGTSEAYFNSAVMHASHGTTAMLPTTLASNISELNNTVKAYEIAQRQGGGAAFIGLHLEGPYFAMSQKGAQDPRYIRNPFSTEYSAILESTDKIKRWSAAPELVGALEFGRYLKCKGVLPSIAHTDAVYEEVVKAYNCGFTHITHLYSAMSSVKRINSYRYAGVVEAAYLIEGMTVEIIADGSHLPSSLLKLVYKLKGADKIALVTDSMRAAGMPEGRSILGSLKDGQEVIVEDGVAKLPDRSAFAGSVATADMLVRNMVNMAEVPLADAVKMMTATPAKIMSIHNKKGSLKKGYDADIIIFDENINVFCTIVGGKRVFSADNQPSSLKGNYYGE